MSRPLDRTQKIARSINDELKGLTCLEALECLTYVLDYCLKVNVALEPVGAKELVDLQYFIPTPGLPPEIVNRKSSIVNHPDGMEVL